MDFEITQWVNLYSDELFKWANIKVNDKDTARDLVQDTFLAALKNQQGFKGESSPKTWLFRILNNKIVDYYRIKQRKQTISIDDNETQNAKLATDSLFDNNQNWQPNGLEGSWSQEENLLDNAEFNKALDFCMEDLPEKWRQLLNYKYLLNKNPDDICQECDISKSNYWQIIHRAKLLMKHCLEVKWFSL